MPNNPVQVIINSDTYVVPDNNAGGGRATDFYRGDDGGFARHRSQIQAQIRRIREELSDSPLSLSYAKVRVQPSAIAKSHRPTDRLFRQDRTPTVGVTEFGELLVEVTPLALHQVETEVSVAEDSVPMREGEEGKLEPHPSRTRSEVGAIESVESYGPSDKREFSVEEAIEWLSQPASGSLLLIQLFRSVEDLSNREPTTNVAGVAWRELQASLHVLDERLQIEAPSEWWRKSGYCYVSIPSSLSRSRTEGILLGAVIAALELSPIVRKVILPPIIKEASVWEEDRYFEGGFLPECMDWSVPGEDGLEPVVAIVDSGVAPIPQLEPWIVSSTDMVDPESQDLSHGTFIAGLLTSTSDLSLHNGFEYEGPCRICDLGIYIVDQNVFRNVYPNGFIDFLEQLDAEVAEAIKLGVRVFSMSLNVETPATHDYYSVFAARLDAIIDLHDVIFVVAAGNVVELWARERWSEDAADVLQALAEYRFPGRDVIQQPAESVRCVTVGALERSDAGNALRPTRYSRRGPGIGFGVKPDLAHIGGSLEATAPLYSFGPDGELWPDRGTSFATPSVAKVLANVDHAIGSRPKRETVLALTVHSAKYPECMRDPRLESVRRDYVGYGIPSCTSHILSTEDYGITLVFESILRGRRHLEFDFAWPAELVGNTGKCRGDIHMTLVYTPPVDYAFGSEAVRVNLDAALRQQVPTSEGGAPKYEGRLSGGGVTGDERNRIIEGRKWSTIKRWNRVTRQGVGKSSQWRVVVTALARKDVELSTEGVPFTLVLTIEDPEKKSPVFDRMRRSLLESNVLLRDIQNRLSVRV